MAICLVVAAWLRRLETVARGVVEEEVATTICGAGSPAAAAERALSVTAVFGEDLRGGKRFRDLLADGLARLASGGDGALTSSAH